MQVELLDESWKPLPSFCIDSIFLKFLLILLDVFVCCIEPVGLSKYEQQVKIVSDPTH